MKITWMGISRNVQDVCHCCAFLLVSILSFVKKMWRFAIYAAILSYNIKMLM